MCLNIRMWALFSLVYLENEWTDNRVEPIKTDWALINAPVREPNVGIRFCRDIASALYQLNYYLLFYNYYLIVFYQLNYFKRGFKITDSDSDTFENIDYITSKNTYRTIYFYSRSKKNNSSSFYLYILGFLWYSLTTAFIGGRPKGAARTR